MANVKDSLERLAESVGISAGASVSTDGSPAKKEGGNWLSKLLGGIHVNGNVFLTKEGTGSNSAIQPKSGFIWLVLALVGVLLIFNKRR